MRTFIIHSVGTPPTLEYLGLRVVKEGSGHYRCPALKTSWVLWRNRWVPMSDEFLLILGEVDKLLQEGKVGLEWQCE